MRVQPTKANDRLHWLAPASILLLAILAYIPAMHGGFLWDDNKLLTECRPVQSPHGLYAIWCTTELIDYLPMMASSFWLEWRLWGANPAGYHVTNILLHAISAVLLWRVLRRLKIPAAWPAALLFAVHPVCVASVTWIAERKNTLSLLFYLLSLLWYFRFEAESSRRRWFILSLTAFVLALLSKSSVVVLPPVLLLCAWWQRGKIGKTDWLRIAPFFALSLAMGLFTMKLQHRGVGFSDDSLMVRIIGGSWALWFYLGKIFLPINLTMIYHRWDISPDRPLAWIPGVLFIGLIIILWRKRRGWGRPGLFALAYFVIALGPVLGVFNMAYFAISRVSDHLQYLAMPGILAFITASGHRLLARFDLRVEAAVTSMVVLILAALTWQHALVFSRPETLWADNVKKNPGAWRVHNSLGAEYFRTGQNEAALAEYKLALQLNPLASEAHYNLGNVYYRQHLREEAFLEFSAAAWNNPESFNADNNAGITLAELGRWEEAIEHYQAAIRARPGFAEAHRNLGGAYLVLKRFNDAKTEFETALEYDPQNAGAKEGLLAVLQVNGENLKNSQPQEARAELEAALKLNPTNATLHNSLGTVFDRTGDLNSAVTEFNTAIKLNPTNATAYKNLGLVFARQQKLAEAISQFQHALKLRPTDADIETELGNVYGRADKPDEAQKHFEAALKIDPKDANAHNGLGVVLDIKNRLDEALGHFQTAVQLSPGLVRARFNLANVYLRKNQAAHAIVEYQTVLKLQPGNAEAKIQLEKIEKDTRPK